MRVMISQPATGMNNDQMARARAEVVAMLEEQGHEVWGEETIREPIPAYVREELWQLGRRFQAMAGADAVYFMDGWEKDRRCRLEYEACGNYGITVMGDKRNQKLEKYIGKIAGCIFSESTFYELSKNTPVGKISSAFTLINVDKKCEPCTAKEASANIFLFVENYLG